MKRLPTALACGLLLALVPSHRRADGEPSLRITLRIDGKEHVLTDGQELGIEVAGKPVRVLATVQDNRRFDAAGIAFDFPRDMAFEYEKAEGVELWTLDGANCVLHVQAFDDGDPEDLAAEVLTSMLQTLEPEAPKPQAYRWQLGKQTHPGLRGRAHMASAEVTIEVTAVGLTVEGRQVVLMLQDSLDDEGKATVESARLLALLKETFSGKVAR